jgi:hypothetical protein
MNLLRAFWRLEGPRRRLVVEAGTLLVLVRLGLRLCSYSRLHRALSLLVPRTRVDSTLSDTEHADVAWAWPPQGALPVVHAIRRWR